MTPLSPRDRSVVMIRVTGTGWLILRSRWRRGLAAQLVLAVVVSLAGTMILATLAGAQRTETAYARFVESYRPPDAFIDLSGRAGVPFTDHQVSAVRNLPQVAASSRVRAMAMEPAVEKLYQPIVTPLDEAWGRDLAVTRYVEGRAPRGAAEISLTEQRARLLGLSIGDTLAMSSFTPQQVDRAKAGDESVFSDPRGPLVELRLVGIERTPGSVATDRDIGSLTMLTRRFSDEHATGIGSWTDLLAVSLTDGQNGVPDFTDAVHAVPGLDNVQLDAGGGLGSSGPTDTLGFVARSLRILALISALAGIFAVTLIVMRIAAVDAVDDAVLGGLGIAKRRRRWLLAVGVAPGTLTGVAVTAAGTVAASTLFPFGLGGRAEPDPGVSVDPVALAVALTLLVAVLALLALTVSAWALRADPQIARRPRTSRIVRVLTLVGAPYPVLMGGHFVLEGGTVRRGMPARIATAGVTLGSAGLVAVLVFTASQTRLVDTPAAWGRTWDFTTAQAFSGPDFIPPESVADRTVVHLAVVEIDGRPLEARGFLVIEGTSLIPLANGRAPGPGEVVLGAAVMDEIDVGIGDTITMNGASGEMDLLVVGQGMFSGIADVPILDVGAALDQDTFSRISDPSIDSGFDTVIIRLAPGVDREPIIRRLAEANGADTAGEEIERILAGDRPDELVRIDEVRALPWLLAGFLGLIAIIATAVVLTSAVQRRRCDFAVLRAVGLDGRGVRGIVLAQATLISILGLAWGVPLGILAGRLLWRTVAEDLGVGVHLEVPFLPVLATTAAVLLVDVIISLVPARRALRALPADELKAD